jgi:hypothetical protein
MRLALGSSWGINSCATQCASHLRVSSRHTLGAPQVFQCRLALTCQEGFLLAMMVSALGRVSSFSSSSEASDVLQVELLS